MPDSETKRLAAPYGDYAVTKSGKVLSYKRDDDGAEVAVKIDKDGYPQVNLANADEAHGFKVFRVHNLVADAFLGERPDGAEVLHKDADRRNCALSNLEYGTRSENATQREADKVDAFVRLDSDYEFRLGDWARTPEGYLRATAVAAIEKPLIYPDEGRQEFVSEDALRTGAESLLHKPVTLEHPPGGVVDQRNWKQYAVGMVVESRYDSDLRAIVAGIVVTDEAAIAEVLQNKTREVSPGYRASVVPDPTYGYRQVKRFSNHLAITKAGRGGSDASIRLDTGATMTEEEKIALLAKLDEAEKDRDALKAKVDAFEAMAKEKEDAEDEKEREDSFVHRFNERVGVIELAQRLDAKVDERASTLDIQRAIVAAKFPALNLDSFSDDQIRATCEAVAVSTPKRNTAAHAQAAWAPAVGTQLSRTDSDDDELFAFYRNRSNA